ncbi:MAG: hypothetical protein GF346_09625 [Candidatus Eisenbacteria bacterium]|nr:hypothetical protein [Candidatus Latescibacterota bacterium]MBD3302692.1 hypothetical protein [Candidatus Eisenbacteria bacterium]
MRVLPRRILIFIALATLPLLAGVAIDLGSTQPRIDRVRALNDRRVELFERAEVQRSLEREAEQLARCIGVAALDSAVAASADEDPVAFLAAAIDDAGLERLELATQTSTEAAKIRRSRYAVRVRGSYAKIVSFIRTVEQAPEVVTVDALTITPALDSDQLEGRIDVSVFEAVMGDGS